ncbi:uncharacterized protein PFLUO_LOCUS688 [Penicillium psychrofluorescens]|uniref:uncharacterized protein n=1 Tax=Penicillium psychrofluorescens TaxID=3158075 RepID=UPI003CCD67F5
MVYVRQHHLPNLSKYRYAGVDHSLISRYILKPFYNKCVIGCFPMGMARRTRQSGPLGELFDHSVDACNTGLGVLIFAAAMNFGQSWGTVLALFGSTMTFYVQTWDEYYTQVLTLGIISGPVEGVLTLCTVYAITAYMGAGSFWHQPALEFMGLSKPAFMTDQIYKLHFTQWYIVYGAFVLFFATGSSIWNVMQVRRQRGLDPFEPLYGLLPMVVIWTLVPAYLYLQPAVLETQLVPFGLYVGLVNAYAVGRMIVGHLVQSGFPYHNVLLYPLALGVVDSAGPRLGLWSTPVLGDGIGQVYFVAGCLGLAVGVYGSFVFDVITTICDYLDIWCLTIKYPYVEETQSRNGNAETASKKMK